MTINYMEEILKKEGFVVKIDRVRRKKIDIRKQGFDELIITNETEGKKDLFIIFINYLKDINHNLTFKNLKRTGNLFMDIIKWLREKKKNLKEI